MYFNFFKALAILIYMNEFTEGFSTQTQASDKIFSIKNSFDSTVSMSCICYVSLTNQMSCKTFQLYPSYWS